MSEKILFVDDDPSLLAACERNFRRQFPLDTAEGGEAGLAKIAAHGPYAVVVADRQMPGMDGIQFLSLVRQRAPDTVRIMLTGNAELEATIRVVNEGNIFRFLTKPCPSDILGKAIEDGRTQYRLVTAEKELLNKTLSGSIKLLTDILSSVDTQSFGRAEQLRSLAVKVTRDLGVEQSWEIHLAAMLAPVGYVTLPPETVLKSRAGEMLSKAEEKLITNVPEIAAKLLANIPRLEGVSKIVHYQQKNFDGTGFPPDTVKGEDIPFGARLLKILTDMAQLRTGGVLEVTALNELQKRQGWYDPALLVRVRESFGGGEAGEVKPTYSATVKELVVGMVLHTDVLTKEGTLVVKAGHQISEMTLEKIQNFDSVSGIREPIFIEGTKA